MKILFTTASVCPQCKTRIPASYIQYDNVVTLKKFCPEHGSFETDVWRGEGFLDWCGDWRPETSDNPDCPDKCGLCENHKTMTCCALLDITNRCNLQCAFCFANGGEGIDMPLEEAYAALDDMYEKGIRYIHISGGEPTVHPDLIAIIRYASEKGFVYIQLNTNGLKIAEDLTFAEQLQQAGTSCVFLQFDGMEDDVFERVRGEKLLSTKRKAIANCDKAQLGVVLVPTIIEGINDNQIGSIIRFAYDNMPAIRGVHFQPVTYTGRYKKGQHYTIPEMLSVIETQTNGLILKKQIQSSACDAPLCGFHVEYRREGDVLHLLQADTGCCCCGESSDVLKNQLHVKNRWTRVPDGDYEEGSFAALRKQLSDQSFFVSGMMFQDLDNLDFGRTRYCSVHVYQKGSVIPFCVYHNLYH